MRYWLWRRVHASFVLISVAVGIVLGVGVGVFGRVWWFESFWWVVVSVVLIVICFLKCRFAVLFLAVVAGVILGGWRAAEMVGDVGYISGFLGKEVVVSGVVYDDPSVDGSGMRLRIYDLEFGEERAVEGNLFVMVSGGMEDAVQRGDRISLRGKMSEGFGSFAGSMYRPEVVAVAQPEPPDVALSVRNGFSENVREYINEPEVELGLGYLLGMRRGLPEEFGELLRAVGVIHLVVTSGFHLSVLVRMARRIFGRVSRFAALFAGLILIVCMVGVTGLTPSMVRAGLVSVLSLLAWYFGRKFHPAKLLLMVGGATLMFNPMYLVDLGWLLSFASFAGVMLLAPIATRYFYGEKKPNFVAQLVVESMAAQICCLPILLYFFGMFSLLSVVANVLIAPTVAFAMLGVFATGCLTFWPFAAGAVAQVTQWVLWCHMRVVEFFGGMAEFIVTIAPENWLVLGLYAPIIGVAIYWWRKSGASLRPVNIVE